MHDSELNVTPPGEPPRAARGKIWASYASLAMSAAVLWPIHQNWRSKPHDSFPLSYYPMFSAKRDAVETFHYVVALDAEGKRYFVPHTVFGSGGLNAVRRQINRMVREDRADEVAKRMAKRLANRESDPWPKVVKVMVVTGKYSVDDYFHGKKEAVSERIRASCPVERKKA